MITVERLTRRFGTVAAVDGITFEVRAGEVFGLLGPDGAGKTTLFRMLAAVLEPSAGTARVAGADVRAAPEQVKSRIGYMPQAFALYGDLTVLENLRFVAEVYGVPRAEIAPRLDRLLGFSRLDRFTGRLADQLSGGMRQKLALAATLLHDPDVLLLDEPTTGVDPVSRREFWQILYELNQSGKTVVVATPYMDEAERCGRVALMHQGRILSVDRPADLRDRFPGTILEVVASPRRAALAAVRALPQVSQATVFGHTLHVVVGDEEAGEGIAGALRGAGIRVEQVRPITPSLEDVFVSLMGRPA
ncbi:MAG TPA: ABC transporter ATP-binding protein [bacterium]|nr:ABC transporter ATP-binding protein [bacterium]